MNGFWKRLAIVVLSLFLCGYVVYQGVQALYDPVRTETVSLYSVYDTIETEGFIVRSETAVVGSVQGHLSFTIDNGNRAAKGEVIARVYQSENDALAQQQYDQLGEEIEQLAAIQSQNQANRTGLDTIDKQIRNVIRQIKRAGNSAAITAADTWQADLLGLLNKRQIIIGKTTDFSQRLADLRARQEALANTFSPSTDAVTAPVAGYFVSSIDGFENTIPYDRVLSATPQEIRAALDAETPTVDATGVIGKMVGNYDWYLLCVLPAVNAAGVGQGTNLTVRLPFVENAIIPATVVATGRDTEGNIAIVLSCSYMSGELSSARREAVEIRLKEYTGLRVSSNCVVHNEAGEQGVYVRVGDTVSFRRIRVLHAEPEYVVCEQVEDAAYLRLYDDVIVSGRGLYDGKIVH